MFRSAAIFAVALGMGCSCSASEPWLRLTTHFSPNDTGIEFTSSPVVGGDRMYPLVSLSADQITRLKDALNAAGFFDRAAVGDSSGSDLPPKPDPVAPVLWVQWRDDEGLVQAAYAPGPEPSELLIRIRRVLGESGAGLVFRRQFPEL